jgi:hypothetical protein
MASIGVRAHFTVKRLLYHLYVSNLMNSPPSMRLKSCNRSDEVGVDTIGIDHQSTAATVDQY